MNTRLDESSSRPPAFFELTTWLLPPGNGADRERNEVGVERALKEIEGHIQEEAQSLAQYRELTTSADPVIGFLAELLARDEHRHHELLGRIAADLRDALNWTHSSKGMPSDTVRVPAVDHLDAAAANRLADEERRTIRQVRDLARELSGLHSGLWSLVLETMALDSEKHERILRHIAERLATAAAERAT